MLADFGYGVLIVSFLLAIYAIGSAVYGYRTGSAKWVESSRLAMQLTFPMISLSALTLIYMLVTDQYNIGFVYEVTSRSMPVYLKVTALWGGQSGSLVESRRRQRQSRAGDRRNRNRQSDDGSRSG